MKKLIYIALILLGVGILSSCGKEGGGSSNSIIGKWKVVYSESDDAIVGEDWEFDKNGAFVVDGYPMYQYRYDASTGIVLYGGSGGFKVISVSLTRMKIAFDFDPDSNYVSDIAELEKIK